MAGEQRVLVTVDRGGRPRRLYYRGRRLQVQQLLDEWEEAGCWWRGEDIRRVYRLLTRDGVIELHHQPSRGWRVARVFD